MDSGDFGRCGGPDIAWGAGTHPNTGWIVVAFPLIEGSSGNLAIARSRAEGKVGAADIGFEEAEAETADGVGAVAAGATVEDVLFNEW